MALSGPCILEPPTEKGLRDQRPAAQEITFPSGLRRFRWQPPAADIAADSFDSLDFREPARQPERSFNQSQNCKQVNVITNEIDAALHEPTNQLTNGAGNNLVSLIVASSPLCLAGTESKAVSTLIVLKSASPEELLAISEPVRAIEAVTRTSPFVVTDSDLKTSTDIFPIRYRNLQHDYRVLAGTDVLANLTFDLEHVRLRCEQELSNVLIRLRNRYVADNGNLEAMSATLQRGAIALLISLRTAIELQTGLAPDDLDGIVADAESTLHIPSSETVAIREAAAGLNSPTPDTVNRVFRLVTGAAERAVTAVDGMEPKIGERV